MLCEVVMSTNADFVKGKLDERIEKIVKRTKRQQNLANLFKISITLLAFVSTVLLGLSVRDESYAQWSRNVAFVIGAAIAAISGIESYWNIQKYWIRNRIIETRLKELRDEFLFLSSKPEGISQDELRAVFERYLSIERRKNEYWEEVLDMDRMLLLVASRRVNSGVGRYLFTRRDKLNLQ
jgi:hypothetical protein